MFWEHQEGGAEESLAVAQQEVEPDKTILHNDHIQAWLAVSRLTVPHILSNPPSLAGQNKLTYVGSYITLNITINMLILTK